MQNKVAVSLIACILVAALLFEVLHPAGFFFPYFARQEEVTPTHKKRKAPPIIPPIIPLPWLDFYSEINKDFDRLVPVEHPSASPWDSAIGQTFQPNASVYLTKCQFYLCKAGAPAPKGIVVARLYEHTGTFGVNGKPTGDPVAESEEIKIEDLPTSMSWVTFNFSGTYKMEVDTPYCITFIIKFAEVLGLYYGPYIGMNKDNATHPGNAVGYYSNSWGTYYNTWDTIFYVYGEP